MKKSQLKQLIREEISKTLTKENILKPSPIDSPEMVTAKRELLSLLANKIDDGYVREKLIRLINHLMSLAVITPASVELNPEYS